ncbi:zinc finger protein 420-like [Oncorhynchus keta]|uniref:zinc finger protein 420-like n=1 Tax=Oncorhynchus keta TaxID=8018 RepID=UPI00227A544E|nr:zinc finger protein 420-like [Oncorhynchus keta]
MVLRRKLLELKVARERAERTVRERVLASRPSIKILDRYRGMARVCRSRGCRSWGQTGEVWRRGTPTTQQRHTDWSSVWSALCSNRGPHHHPSAAQNPTQHHGGSDHRSDPERLGPLGCPPAPGSEYLPVFHQSQRTVNSHGDVDGDALDTVSDDPSCSYTTEMDPGKMPLGLETQTDLSREDWNRYSSSVYSKGCLDKKGEVIVVDEVKVEGDAPPTWNTDSHLGDGHSQGRDFLNYRGSLETNLNVATHSSLDAFRGRDPVFTSMAPSDSHGQILFDQVLNSNDRARAQVQGEGATSGNSKEKRFLCMFCNKGFSCPQKVERHQRVHTGEKPFSCTQCEKRFSRQDNLKMHQRVHTGEKPFSCTQCHMRFALAGNLKMHLKVHTGERPFACTHCGKRFSERRYLRIHQQKNHPTL